MTTKKCSNCGEEKTSAHYIRVKSSFFDGSLPICRKCLSEMIEVAAPNDKWNIVNKLCQWADIPFVPAEFEKLYLANGKDAFGMYAAIFRDDKYQTLDWRQYNDVYLQLEQESRVEDALPELKEKRMADLRRKWGISYDEEQIEYLENLHQGLINSQNVVGALNEDQALKLCKISLIIEEKIRAGVDFTKDLKAYDELAKLANLTPKNVKDANEFDSAGEIFAYLERTGWVNKYYDHAVRDEVDNTEKNIKNWLRYLYVNETGVAEEIQQRIDNLKTTAELTGEEFDESGFTNYLKAEAQDNNEDFKIDLEE